MEQLIFLPEALFASLGKLKDDDWTKIRDTIKKSNEKDKNLRNTK